MKYYSIHFNSVDELKRIMSIVFKMLNRTGICVHFFKDSEYRYDFVVNDKLTFVCVIRAGIGYITGIRVLGNYSTMREPNNDPKQIFDWIMDKYQCDVALNIIEHNYIKNDIKATSELFVHHPQIKKVIFNDPATIVFWSDGSKTVVKAQNGEAYDQEKGLAMAITKKWFGNKGNYYNNIKKYI